MNECARRILICYLLIEKATTTKKQEGVPIYNYHIFIIISNKNMSHVPYVIAK